MLCLLIESKVRIRLQFAFQSAHNRVKTKPSWNTQAFVSKYFLIILLQVRLPRYESITLDLKKQLRQEDVKEFFLDIVKDIANDLNLKSLTQKIIVNLTVLLNADGGSLYLVQEMPSGKKCLVSKVTPRR